MRLNSKTIVWSWVGLTLIFSVLIFGAYSKLSPDSLVDMLEHKVSEIIPRSTLKVGKVSYGIALDFKLSLSEIQVLKDNKDFIHAKSIEMRVPWWLILLNRGDIHLSFEDVSVLVSANEAKDLSLNQSKSELDSPKVIQLKIPEYLMNAKYSIRGKNLLVKDIEEDRHYLSVSKIVVRDFKFDKNSAFEINIPISINLRGERYSTELWLFGDVTPGDAVWNLNYRGEFKTLEMNDAYRLDDLVLDGTAAFTPAKYQVNSSLDLSIDKVKVGEGSFYTNSTIFDLNFNFSKLPLNYLSLFGPDIVHGQKLHGVSTGSLKAKRNLNLSSQIDINVLLQYDNEFQVSNDSFKKGQWLLNYSNDDYKMSFESIDKNFKFSLNKVAKTKSAKYEINNEPLSNVISVIPNLNTYLTQAEMQTSLDLSIKNSEWEKENHNLLLKAQKNEEEITYLLEDQSEKSKFNLKFNQKNGLNKIESKFSNSTGKIVGHVIGPYIAAENFLIDGLFKGEWIDLWEAGKWEIKYQTNAGIRSNSHMNVWTTYLMSLFSLDQSVEKSKFDIKIHQGKIDFKNTHWIKNEQVELKGILSDNPQIGSHVILNYPMNKNWKEVKKEVNSVFWRSDKNEQ